MKIVIGSTPIRPVGKNEKGEQGGVLEAKVLEIRNSRRRPSYPQTGNWGKRRMRETIDPDNSCVLTLLVPQKNKMPKDLKSGKYKIYLRFKKQR